MARGSIVKRGKSWSVVVNVQRDPKTGKRTQIWKSAPTKKAAEKVLTGLLKEMDQGKYIKPSKDTLGAYLERWLSDFMSTQVRATTFEGYQYRAKHLIEVDPEIRTGS